MAWKSFVLFVAVIYCVSAEEEAFHYLDHEFDRTELGDDIARASMRFIKEAYASASDKNVVASPLGAFTLLSMYAGGAGPSSKDEIVRVLGAANYTELSDSYEGLGARLSSLDPNFFTLANKVYLSNQYSLDPLFASLATRSHGEVETINFSNTKQATDIINQWGEAKTRGFIKNPVPEDALTPDTAVALFNVIFFQGQWNVPFEAKNTKEEDFYVDATTTVKKPTMNLVQALFYYESKDLESKIIELPYKEKNFRMIVVLPNKVDGLSSLLDKALTRNILEDVFSISPAYSEIDLRFPKFKIDSEFNLNNLLPKVGIKKIYTDGAPGIVRERSVVVSKSFQKAFVKVDEEGATAGAFTGVIAVPVSSFYEPPPPMVLKVDHPFLFFIMYEDKILFTGTYTH